MGINRTVLIWVALGAVLAVPMVAAAFSPFLQYRDSIYIVAGFAGIAAFGLLLVQPLLAGRWLPGLLPAASLKAHRLVGLALVAFVIVHVGGLWITSPPDVVDVLLFRSPTPFSIWGAFAMWAVFLAAFAAIMHTRMGRRPRTWRMVHVTFALITAAGTILHALQIQGTMETNSKIGLSMAVGLAAATMVKRVLLQSG
jgi:Ferric reductase like transmembrane component